MTISFSVALFRSQFAAFANATTYPDATLQGYWDAAACYVSDTDYGYLSGNCRLRALNLMTAHLTALSDRIASGENPSMVSASSIDKVSVTLTPPPVKSQFQWWLSTTPYGAQLFALLQSKAVGGFYVGGLPETAAFRKVYGVF